MKSSAKNISLNSYDDIFSTEETREDAKREKVTDMPLSELPLHCKEIIIVFHHTRLPYVHILLISTAFVNTIEQLLNACLFKVQNQINFIYNFGYRSFIHLRLIVVSA